MLKSIYIRNYALIEELDISFDQGLTVITGETGAGKSIILGALGLILGQRANPDLLGKPDEKCVIEGHFAIQDYELEPFFETNDLDYLSECIIRREISPGGKSRAFINDTPAGLPLLKELGEQLVDVHSQHKTLALNASDVQLSLLDQYAGNESLLKAYRKGFQLLKDKMAELHRIREAEMAFVRERDYLQFQYDELATARPQEGETAALEAELKRIQNASQIRDGLFFSAEMLSQAEDNICSKLKETEARLAEVSRHLPEAQTLADRMKEARIEVNDIADEVLRLSGETEIDTTRLEVVQDRLDTLFSLMSKHGLNDEQGLHQLMKSLEKSLEEGNSREDSIKALEKEVRRLEDELLDQALLLQNRRKEVCDDLENQIQDLLTKLAMKDASFKIELETLHSLGVRGLDNARFMFSANRGSKRMEVAQVASGGERSRLMLAVKSCITQKNIIPTLIFDEIDTGVSGEIAKRVGDMLEEMGKHIQLVCITHLPQIAAKGQKHYRVYKEDGKEAAYTRVQLLDQAERVREIAELLSGKHITETAAAAARELLLSAQTPKQSIISNN